MKYNKNEVTETLRAIGIRIDTLLEASPDTHHDQRVVYTHNGGSYHAFVDTTQRDDLTVNHVVARRITAENGIRNYRVEYTETKDKTPPNPHHDRSIDTPYDHEFKSVVWNIYPSGTISEEGLDLETVSVLKARTTELEYTNEPELSSSYDDEVESPITTKGRLSRFGLHVIAILKNRR